MVHQEKPQRMLRLFCRTIPSGTDSHFAQALVFVSRGLVAKRGLTGRQADRTEFLTRPLMVHQSTRCKKLQRVFYCNLSKKVQSGAPSGDENSSGPPPVRRAKTPQWGVFRARESPRWCTRKRLAAKQGAFLMLIYIGRIDT